MEETTTYVIVSDDGFWNKGRWVKEYPDAQVWTTYTSAEKAFTKIESDFRFDSTDDLMLIENYGYDFERVVLFGGRIDE